MTAEVLSDAHRAPLQFFTWQLGRENLKHFRLRVSSEVKHQSKIRSGHRHVWK
jgi:hypothetical protein